MASIRYLVPYQVDIDAYDLTSLEQCGNTFYLRSGVQLVSPPAFGAPIAGSSTTTALLAAFQVVWETFATEVLSVKYKLRSYTMRGIVGKQYATPSRAILSLSIGTSEITIVSSGPHGLVNGESVRIFGVTSPFSVNGNFVATVVNGTTFTIALSISPVVWTGDGFFQRAGGALTFTYVDKETLISTAVGGISGDTLPIFSTISVQRLNAGVGRNWRSRFELSPIGESFNDFGKLTTAAIASVATSLTDFNVGVSNGGSDTGSQNSYQVAISRQLAMAQLTPFTESASWCRICDIMTAHTNLGSLTARKPRLS